MVSEAKRYEAEDSERRKTVESKNRLDSLIYQTEKLVKENQDKLDAATKGSMETALAEAKKALEGEDRATMDAQYESLQQASHAMAQALYGQAAQAQAGAGCAGGTCGGGAQAAGGEDEVVDAEFTEHTSG